MGVGVKPGKKGRREQGRKVGREEGKGRNEDRLCSSLYRAPALDLVSTLSRAE